LEPLLEIVGFMMHQVNRKKKREISATFSGFLSIYLNDIPYMLTEMASVDTDNLLRFEKQIALSGKKKSSLKRITAFEVNILTRRKAFVV